MSLSERGFAQSLKGVVCFKENALFLRTNSASWSKLSYSLTQRSWSAMTISEFINSYVRVQRGGELA